MVFRALIMSGTTIMKFTLTNVLIAPESPAKSFLNQKNQNLKT